MHAGEDAGALRGEVASALLLSGLPVLLGCEVAAARVVSLPLSLAVRGLACPWGPARPGARARRAGLVGGGEGGRGVSTRSREAPRLARGLWAWWELPAGSVEVRWSAGWVRDGYAWSWEVAWCAGPTVQRMRDAAVHCRRSRNSPPVGV